MTRVCPECFDNTGLKRRLVEIRPSFPDEKCDFHPRFKGIPTGATANIIDEVFRNNYGFGHYNSMQDDFTGESLEEVIRSLTFADDERVVRAIMDDLIESDPYWPPDGGEPFYQEDASYERNYDAFQGHGYIWDEFRRSIVHEQRFFNDAAKELLAKIFDGVHRQRDTGRRQPVTIIEPNTPEARFIRARLADNVATRKDIEVDPAHQMGPPPMRRRRPGRMNPSGIRAFYAAYDLLTCIAELRPRVGSIIASAEFEITSPLVALDMTRFAGEPKEPNLFAKDHIKRMAQWRFMQSFMHEIAQPISPDEEHLDYIPTQAVGEYLLHQHKIHLNGQERRIEAIIFHSAQNPTGKNIVIFGDACTVKSAPATTEKSRQGVSTNFDSILGRVLTLRSSEPEPRLRYQTDSLQHHRIEQAEFRPVPYEDLPDWREDEPF